MTFDETEKLCLQAMHLCERGYEADGLHPEEDGVGYRIFRRAGTYDGESTNGDSEIVEPLVWWFLKAFSIGVGIYERPVKFSSKELWDEEDAAFLGALMKSSIRLDATK